MADLMKGTYTYSKLEKDYGNFVIPAAKLKVGGSNILGLSGLTVESIQVKLSLKAAGSAVFTVSSVYDYKNRSFDSSLKSKIILGKEVEVELGYGSKTTVVFKGFIASVGMDFDVESGISYQITALDARRLMMSDNNRILEHKGANYSAIVKDVLKRYKKLCKAQVEDTSEKLEDRPVAQNSSDYDFIVNRIIGEGKVDREFFIVADTAYFRKPRGTASPLMTLGIGQGLKSFQRNAVYLDQEIQVVGRQAGTSTVLTGTASAKSKDKQTAALGDSGILVITAPECLGQADLTARAKAKAQELQNQNSQASASCVGLAEIVPGRYIKIDKVDDTIDNTYYITDVTHSYSRGGFVTKFEMEGWK